MGSRENKLDGSLLEGIHKKLKPVFGKWKLLTAISQEHSELVG